MIIPGVAAVVALAMLQTPAEATGHAQRGANHITVRGSGLYVKSVTTSRSPHRYKAQARLVMETRHGVRQLQPYQDTNFSTSFAGGRERDYDYRTWTLKRKFANGTRLCSEWKGYRGRACVIIHK
ncbi:hypothetical protein [Streptomyces sp. Ac-502]|uniref:hypothetical protein n=1 Tax=Streptomyces sp. Ac-502 TaxID=3342801 RepID=UPI0038627138